MALHGNEVSHVWPNNTPNRNLNMSGIGPLNMSAGEFCVTGNSFGVFTQFFVARNESVDASQQSVAGSQSFNQTGILQQSMMAAQVGVVWCEEV